MRGLIVLSVAALLILGLVAYQSPRVRELFDSAPAPAPAAKERPASPPVPEVAGDRGGVARPADSPPAGAVKPAVKPTPDEAPESRPRARKTASPTPEPSSQPPPKPTVSNAEVSSVLMGIFRARQIYGVSLMVSDTEIEVAGEVASEQQRRQVLDTIEKAREYRRLIAKDLRVRQP